MSDPTTQPAEPRLPDRAPGRRSEVRRPAPRRGRLGRSLLAVVGALAFMLLAAALPASAATTGSADSQQGVLVRVAGDVQVPASETIDVVVVVQGDLTMEGTATVVVVVNGTATLRGASVETLVVVDGAAVLSEGTIVSGDVVVPSSTITDDGSTRIDGSVVDDLSGFTTVFRILDVVLTIGGAIVTVLAALLFAAIAPRTIRSATSAVRTQPGQVALSGLLFWIALPLLAVALLISVIGAPTAFAIWVGLMPAVAFAGYLVSAIWLGELLVDRRRERAHPYAAALLGAVILVLVGLVPILGALVGLVAALVGGSALVLLAWRAFRSRKDTSAVAGQVGSAGTGPAWPPGPA